MFRELHKTPDSQQSVFMDVKMGSNSPPAMRLFATIPAYVRVFLIGTLSIDDGNGNGDWETEERLGRGRGCGAKLKAVKQAQDDGNFCRRRLKMPSLKEVRHQLMLSHFNKEIND